MLHGPFLRRSIESTSNSLLRASKVQDVCGLTTIVLALAAYRLAQCTAALALVEAL
jgi:hypothetical protein